MTRPLILALALFLAVAHGSLLSDWLIDDAGISFAYARNLALGHGLVSQPGAEPLEGFSNPLWTLLLAPFFALRAFDPAWTPKLVSHALLLAAFFAIVRCAEGHGVRLWLAASPPLFLALDSSFMIWTTSGLENPLLAALLALSAALSTNVVRWRADLAAGAVAGLLALTRPDAIVYAAAYPLALLWTRPGLAALPARLWRHVLGFALTFGPYLVFRRVYFGDWLPNTFHAKVHPWMLTVDPMRLWELTRAATGRWAWPALFLAALASALVLARRRLPLRAFVLLVHLSLASAAYLLLPPDWMGEFRFATGFFIFFYWLLGEAAAALWTAWPRGRWLVPAGLALLLAETTAVHAARTAEFAAAPAVPFARISTFARAYDRLAAGLGPGRHSLLTPDLGGMLFHARLAIYDLAGLCDRTVARTLMEDTPAFHEYVFATVRPTFIHVHGSWADWARLHRDPRFARDYAPLHEVWERPAPGDTGEPWSGDYVRRDAVAEAGSLERLRAEFRELGLDQPLP